MNAQTLLLDCGFQPIKAIPWQRAITLITLGKCEVVSEYDGFVRSSTLVLKMPAVVRLLRVFKRFRTPVKFCRINIFARDNFQCQYCGKQFRVCDLTYDHVLPRSKGGLNKWTNIVSACMPCNNKKGGRTPEQAGMTLRNIPVEPKWVPAIQIQLSGRSTPDEWRDWLYWNDELKG